jgi:hypothetical protein
MKEIKLNSLRWSIFWVLFCISFLIIAMIPKPNAIFDYILMSLWFIFTFSSYSAAVYNYRWRLTLNYWSNEKAELIVREAGDI